MFYVEKMIDSNLNVVKIKWRSHVCYFALIFSDFYFYLQKFGFYTIRVKMEAYY